MGELLIRITPRGLQRLDEQPKATGSKVLIAMSFDKRLDPVKEAIEQGISDAGYEPIRVDDDHYHGGVIDRIIGHIRESRFIIADFTGNRGGVYYEAGVAFGLGIPVLHVCASQCLDEKHSDRLHFDVRHLVFTPWTVDKLGEFRDRLRDRILGAIGRGPKN